MKSGTAKTNLRCNVRGVRQLVGRPQGRGLRIGVVASQFNSALMQSLVDAAAAELVALGVRPADITVAWVPGAFEIPLVIERWAGVSRFDALLSLGVIIEGDTPHAGLISREVTHAVSELSRRHQIPILDGVVAVRNLEQARERCAGMRHNRGRHAARAAVYMARLLEQLGKSS